MKILNKLRNYAAATIAAASIALSPGSAEAEDAQPAEDPVSLTAETMVLEDLHSDTRVEVEHSGLEVAVEQVTDDDYDSHSTILGLRTPDLSGFQLRQTGLTEYGAGQETGGAFNTNMFYTIPSIDLRLGGGGGASFPNSRWIVHGNAQYWGDFLRIVGDVMYDSQEGHANGRGFASILAGPFYMSLGKAAGPNLVNFFGLIQGEGTFEAGLINRMNYEALSSNHCLFFTWNSTYGRGGMDFKTNLYTAADGLADFVFDPTIGWAPMLNMFGEYALMFNLDQNSDGIGGGAMFSYNPSNRGNFLELGVGYRHNFEGEEDITATLNAGTNLGPITVMAGTTADIMDGNIAAWLYLGKKFDL